MEIITKWQTGLIDLSNSSPDINKQQQKIRATEYNREQLC